MPKSKKIIKLAACLLLHKLHKKRTGPKRKKRQHYRDPDRMKSNRTMKQMLMWKKNDKKWISNVGMTYPTFKALVFKIKRTGAMTRKRSDGATITERLLIVLNLFRYGKHLRDIETNVGKAHNTIGSWRKQVCKALSMLSAELIQLPVTEEDLKDVADGFARFGRSRMINCVGAIDGTHIKIQSTDMAYRNYKKFDSINCQVICDHMFYIRHICAGGPGCYSDKTMYTVSGIDEWVQYIKNQNVLDIEGVPVGYWIAADGIYTGYGPGIVTPHEAKFFPLSPAQRDFDFYQSSNRMVIEQW